MPPCFQDEHSELSTHFKAIFFDVVPSQIIIRRQQNMEKSSWGAAGQTKPIASGEVTLLPRRAPTRLSEDLNMVAKKVADTSPDVPAAKRAKILPEDDGNEGEVGIAERVGE